MNRIALVTNVGELAGLACAHALAENGMTVVCHDNRFVESGERTEFEANNPGLMASVEQGPKALVDSIISTYGQIDVLFSNDAFPTGPKPVEEISDEQFQATVDVLMKRPFQLFRAVAPHMKARRTGNIILLSSAGPMSPYPFFSCYCAARAGGANFVVSLARELAPYNVSINGLLSNFLDSETYLPAALFKNSQAGAAYLRANVPMQRLGDQQEMAELVAFLASGKCNFVNGSLIPFTGGWPLSSGIPSEITEATEIAGSLPRFAQRPMPRSAK
jgi:NAD(P)-dependent dehydrogenase (short-subunit alcohol dehydrogenase family)